MFVTWYVYIRVIFNIEDQYRFPLARAVLKKKKYTILKIITINVCRIISTIIWNLFLNPQIECFRFVIGYVLWRDSGRRSTLNT